MSLHKKTGIFLALSVIVVFAGLSGWRFLYSGQEPDSVSTPAASPQVRTAVPSSTSTPQPTVQPTHTPQPTDAIEPTPTGEPFPESHYITNITGHRQYFSLGCEAAVAFDWAAYFGVNFNEFEFQFKLPMSDNPDFGFVGSVYDPWGQVPPYSYGVHAGPVADLLTEYGLPASGIKNFTLEELKEEIANDRPIIAWVIGNVVGGIPHEYTDSQGNTTIVAAYEHVVIVTGYNETSIRYMTNGRFYDTPVDNFLNSWGVLQNMVVVRAD
jgi:uncharacterized protein YvpB